MSRVATAVTRLVAGLLGAGLLGGCATPSVDAGPPPYDPTTLTSGAIVHWPVGRGIAIHVVPEPQAGDDRLASSARTSAIRWGAALGYREHVLRVVDDATDADIIIRDARSAAPVETSCGGPGWTEAAATTFFCPLGDTARTLTLLNRPPGRTKVLITVNVEALSGTTAVLSVVLHELGHALGIAGHSSMPGDAMYAAPQVVTPSRRDALTLRYLLHRPADVTL